MKEFLYQMKDCYIKNNTPAFAAALAYYLVFSIFPVIGVFNILVSALGDTVTELLDFMPFVSPGIMDIYMNYLETYPGVDIMSVGLVVILYMPFRAVKLMLYDMKNVYGIERNMPFYKSYPLILLYTAAFLVFMVYTAVVMAVSGEVIAIFLGETLWHYVKYLMPILMMFIFLLVLFKTGTRRKFREIYIGALLSSCGWHIASIVFSVYVNTLGKYTVIYGSLGTIMAFFVWLYLTCFCILMGVRFNRVMEQRRKKV